MGDSGQKQILIVGGPEQAEFVHCALFHPKLQMTAGVRQRAVSAALSNQAFDLAIVMDSTDADDARFALEAIREKQEDIPILIGMP